MSKDFAPTPFEDPRFWSKVDQHSGVVVLETECWLWTAANNGNGYGVFTVQRKHIYAHRYSWEQTHNEKIQNNLQIDHLCKNTLCVNPDHLEPVTHRENLMRSSGWAAINANKTHCPQGHEYTKENTRIADGSRDCRICDKNSSIIKARSNGVREMGTYRPALSKLTFELAEEIRAKYIPRKYSQLKLAEEYGVSQTVISAIIRKKIWKKKLDDE